MKKALLLFCTFSCFSTIHSDFSWTGTPYTLSTTGVNSTNPVVAMDGSGNAVAVWVENGIVKSSNMQNGSWGASNTLSGSGASSPCLVVDSNGNANAIWILGGVVQGATQAFNMSWGTATALSLTGSSSPALAVDSSGNVVAVWANGGAIQSETKLVNGSWPMTPSPDPLGGTSASLPQVAIGNDGTVVAVWQDIVSSINTIFQNTKTIIGATWGTASVISNSSINSVNPQVAMDVNGNAMAIWYQYIVTNSAYSNVYLEGSYHPKSGSWGGPSIISNEGFVNPANLVAKLVVDKFGNSFALWTSSPDGAYFNNGTSIYTVNQGWYKFTYLVVNNLYSISLDAACSDQGVCVAVFMQYDSSGSLNIAAANTDYESNLISTWDTPIVISQGTSNAYPRIAGSVVGNNFNVSAVWETYDGSNTLIQTKSGNQTLLPAPGSPTVTQLSNPLGVFTEYYNKITWTSSTGAVGYAVYRNSEIIANVDSSVLEWIDNNQPQNGPVTYYIAAYDSDFIYSPFAQVSYP